MKCVVVVLLLFTVIYTQITYIEQYHNNFHTLLSGDPFLKRTGNFSGRRQISKSKLVE